MTSHKMDGGFDAMEFLHVIVLFCSINTARFYLPVVLCGFQHLWEAADGQIATWAKAYTQPMAIQHIPSHVMEKVSKITEPRAFQVAHMTERTSCFPRSSVPHIPPTIFIQPLLPSLPLSPLLRWAQGPLSLPGSNSEMRNVSILKCAFCYSALLTGSPSTPDGPCWPLWPFRPCTMELKNTV